MAQYEISIDRRLIERRTLTVEVSNRQSLTRGTVFGDANPQTNYQPLEEWAAVEDPSDDYEQVWIESAFVTEIKEIE